MIQCVKSCGKYDGSGIEFFFPPCENHQLSVVWVNGVKQGDGSIFVNTGVSSDQFLHGTFVDDELNGHVQLFYESSGNVKMEGTAKNGMWNGIIKEYDEDGKVIFEGEYVNGLRHGNGVENGQRGVWKEGIQIDGTMADQMKLSEYEKEIESMKSKMTLLEKENQLLRDENKKLKMQMMERISNVPITQDTNRSSVPEVTSKSKSLSEVNVGETKGPINPTSKNNSNSVRSGPLITSSVPSSSSSSSSCTPAPPSLAPKMPPPVFPKALPTVATSHEALTSSIPPTLLKNSLSSAISTHPSPSDCTDVVCVHIDNDYSEACFCGKDGSITMVEFHELCFMPTTLGYVNGSFICGIENNASCIINNIMKILGRNNSDEAVQKVIDKCGCPVINQNGIPVYDVGSGKRVTAVEALSEIMKHIKEVAEKQSGNNMRKCVLSISNWFDTKKRECMKEAAEMSGLRVAHVVINPTAAAFYFTHSHEDNFNGNVLVCELTSYSFATSLIQCNGEEVCFRGGDGTDDMGYEDMIMDMYKYVEKEYKRERGQALFSGLHGKSLSRSKTRLLRECEDAFDGLVNNNACVHPIDVGDDAFDIHFPSTPSGQMFERSAQIILKVIGKCVKPIHVSLKDVKKVVWVSRKGLPNFVRDMLVSLFGNERIVDLSHRDSHYDAIVKGAMMFAKVGTKARGSIKGG